MIGTADVDPAFITHQGGVAFGTMRGELEFGQRPCAFVLFHAHDMGNDFASLFDHHHIADPDIFALDFVGVMEAGMGHHGSRQKHRLEIGHRRDDSRFPYLHPNV